MIQGTLGLYDEDKNAVHIVGKSPNYHQWEPFAPYQEEFDHSWWKEMAVRLLNVQISLVENGRPRSQLLRFSTYKEVKID